MFLLHLIQVKPTICNWRWFQKHTWHLGKFFPGPSINPLCSLCVWLKHWTFTVSFFSWTAEPFFTNLGMWRMGRLKGEHKLWISWSLPTWGVQGATGLKPSNWCQLSKSSSYHLIKQSDCCHDCSCSDPSTKIVKFITRASDILKFRVKITFLNLLYLKHCTWQSVHVNRVARPHYLGCSNPVSWDCSSVTGPTLDFALPFCTHCSSGPIRGSHNTVGL